jgi:carbon monoxide dehydrogenase subunit G
MNIEVQESINGSLEEVWRVITDIDNSVNVISGIEEIEVLERPEEGLVGLKWRETRTLFGKTATEVMWITDAEENAFYATRAESHGSIYITHLTIVEQDGGTLLTMNFGAELQSFTAKVMSATMGWMFKNATIKAVQQDLTDNKAAVEQPQS